MAIETDHPVTDALVAALNTVQRPGEFYAAGTVVTPIPCFSVEGVGVLSFPLPATQAEQLITVAEQAPYGRGAQTLVDPEIRRVWQIAASEVEQVEPHWNKTLAEIVKRVSAELGVDGKVSAELYKMLLYDQGSFFVEHRDTEKAAGMFATLVVVLPSIYRGGELIVRHGEREVCLELASGSVACAAYAAFYADCRHEVRPVIEGNRLALIYNLIRRGRGPRPVPPDHRTAIAKTVELINDWIAVPDDGPVKIVYPLEHHYTPAALAFDSLKNADAAVASVLTQAAAETDCTLSLAMISIAESGSAEHTGYYGRRRGRYWDHDEDSDDFEAGEIYDRTQVVGDWIASDGRRIALGAIPFREEELSPSGALDNEPPDEEHFSEATGNEGASFERTYRRAALVLWPNARFFAVAAQAGLRATLPYLQALSEQWAASGDGRASSVWQDAHALARQMIDQWPTPTGWAPSGADGDVESMLASLVALDAVERIEDFLTTVVVNGRFNPPLASVIASACAALDPTRAAHIALQIVEHHGAASFGACAKFVAELGPLGLGTDGVDRLCPTLSALVETLPGDPKQRAPIEPWERRGKVDGALITHLLSTLWRVDASELATRAVAHILAWPQTFGPDAAVVPAALTLAKRADPTGPGFEALRQAALDHLEARIAQPLDPPADWAQPVKLKCRCKYCGELQVFLSDPSRKQCKIPAAERHRGHLDQQIISHDCDVNTTVERVGRPYRLACTKTRRSYDARCAQRKQDLDARARLNP